MKQSTTSNENLIKEISVTSEKSSEKEQPQLLRDAVSRKEQLNRENTARAAIKNDFENTLDTIAKSSVISDSTINENKSFYENPEDKSLILKSGRSGITCSSQYSSYKKSSLSASTSANNFQQSSLLPTSTRRQVAGEQGFTSCSVLSSPCRSSTSSRNSSHRNSLASTQNTSRNTSLPSKSSRRQKVKPSCSQRTVSRKLTMGYPNNGRSFDSNNNNNKDSKKITNPVVNKRKQVSFSYLTTDDLCLSEHDRRILESMAMKKEIERESNELAHQAHLLWEQDREAREQLMNEQAAYWKEYVAEKRQLQNMENAHRWEEMKRSLRHSQQILEANIREKEQRAAKLKKSVEQKKLMEASERHQQAAKRRAEVEAAQQKLEIETAIWQQSLDEKQRVKLERAESARNQNRESFRRRVASANRVEELRHQEKWAEMKAETEATLRELKHLCQMRDRHAQQRYALLVQDRDRQLKEQSLERSLKFQQVHKLHKELDKGLKLWQDQVSVLHWESIHKAKHKAMEQIEMKRTQLELENKAREKHHKQLMDRICKEEEARICYIRELISHKEARMKHLASERDLAIQESRLQAQTTADLREHLRCTLSPETFDRKVAHVALEMRLSGRPPSASPTMTMSHIYLG
ncbi:coiled-coil domain-containing protein 177-like isoform X2 [Bacillus rossius redtenbacheri]